MITIRKAVAADAVQLLEFMKRIGGETDNLTFGGEGLPFSVEDEYVFVCKMNCDLRLCSEKTLYLPRFSHGLAIEKRSGL
jgi:hypothetical protein